MPKSKKPAKEKAEEGFLVRYSPNYEFPLSSLLSVGVHILALVAATVLAKYLWQTEREPVPIGSAMVINDLPDGSGQAGSGGGQKDFEKTVQDPSTPNPPMTDAKLQEVTSTITAWAPDMKLDPKALEQIAKSPNFERFDKLNDRMKRELLDGMNNKKGSGANSGTGNTGQAGTGVGGDGNSTSERTVRWIVTLRPDDTQDYLNQLMDLGAKVYLTMEPDGEKGILITSENRNSRETVAVSGGGQMFFVDDRIETRIGFRELLSVKFTPREIIAVFPREVEDELAAKEIAYQGRKPAEIRSTRFNFIRRNGKFDIIVVDQKLKLR